MDIVGSLVGILLFAPVFLAISAAIKFDSPGPVFFRQIRVGRHGRPFRILKFRSMVTAAPTMGPPITTRSDSRITRVGAFLRAGKLDELPQLFNVLKGEMSLVGPRPEVPDLIKFYPNDKRALILSLRPGMTDYASILFRNENELLDTSNDPIAVYSNDIIPMKVAYYEQYCRDVGVLTDLRIILATILLLLFKHIPKGLRIEDDQKRVLTRTC